MIHDRPFSDACEQNKLPILEVLREQLTEPQSVLELSSGTGQHAVFFARELPHLNWQPTDLAENLAGIQSWIDYAAQPNVLPPLQLDVGQKEWNIASADCVFSANAVHIMSWNHVIAMFSGLTKIANTNARLIIYGPFNYANEYTSDSNRQFDFFLRQRDPTSGIRNFEDVDELPFSHECISI